MHFLSHASNIPCPVASCLKTHDGFTHLRRQERKGHISRRPTGRIRDDRRPGCRNGPWLAFFANDHQRPPRALLLSRRLRLEKRSLGCDAIPTP